MTPLRQSIEREELVMAIDNLAITRSIFGSEGAGRRALFARHDRLTDMAAVLDDEEKGSRRRQTVAAELRDIRSLIRERSHR